MKNLTFFILVIISCCAYSQDSLLIKGYVIDPQQVLFDVTVSVASSKVTTLTDFKGRFKIWCHRGDTLIFEKSSYYKIEKYVVTDSSPLIIKLILNVSIDKYGRESKYGSVSNRYNLPKITMAGSVTDKNVYTCGYNFFPEPFFPDKPYIPILNRLSMGLNISKDNDKYYIFPNAGIIVRNIYNDIFNSDLTFSFLAPSVKLGYWFNEFERGKNGFGYELGLNVFNFYLHRVVLLNATFDIKYNNYLTRNGTFMIGLSINKSISMHGIPEFIEKQLPK